MHGSGICPRQITALRQPLPHQPVELEYDPDSCRHLESLECPRILGHTGLIDPGLEEAAVAEFNAVASGKRKLDLIREFLCHGFDELMRTPSAFVDAVDQVLPGCRHAAHPRIVSGDLFRAQVYRDVAGRASVGPVENAFQPEAGYRRAESQRTGVSPINRSPGRRSAP